MSETTLRHIEHFTNTIGPRGSATPKEAEAHDYCQSTLEGLGYEAHRETFLSPLSGWHPYALAEGAMLVAVALFVLLGQGADAGTGALAAAALSIVVLIAFYLHITHRGGPLQWFLPTDRSQNVWAVARPSGEERHSVVLTGHVDTHRTALAMQSPVLWQVFQALTFLLTLANLALAAVFIWGVVSADALPRTVALILAIVPAISLVFTLQPDFTPYVKGANDNASAAAVLAFAERLKAEPLEHTAVFLVNTGCEEVGCFGLMDWIERHAADDAEDADYLVLDNIAGQGSEVNYVLDETVLMPVSADPDLVALAEEVAGENPALGAKPFHYRGLYSELSIASVYGQRALGLLNFDPRTKMPPNFHTARDDMSNIDAAVLERSEQFAWAILKKLDADAQAGGEEPAAGEKPATAEQPVAAAQPAADDNLAAANEEPPAAEGPAATAADAPPEPTDAEAGEEPAAAEADAAPEPKAAQE